MNRYAISPGNSGFPTLQMDNIGFFFLIRCFAVAFEGKHDTSWFLRNGGMFLYNLLWSIFLGPYTVKYFLYQYLRSCLGLLFFKF